MNVKNVLSRLNITILEEVGEHLWALCPFHQDTKPSWRIRSRGDRRGLHWCFACSEGGDLADLVMHVRGYLNKQSAHDWLAEHGEQIEREDLIAPALRVSVGGLLVRGAFRLPRGFEAGPLQTWPTVPRLYAQERGLTAEQVETWSIGYACEGKLGGRLVIPMVSRFGLLSGYMARSWDKANRRKYLYPREDERPDLDVMFGETRWMRGFPCVVTEGALKSLAVERAFGGVFSHATVGGSNIRPMHLAKLAGSGFSKIIVMTDSDDAGEKAGDELVRALTRHVPTARCRLEKGQDADSVPLPILRSALAPYVG